MIKKTSEETLTAEQRVLNYRVFLEDCIAWGQKEELLEILYDFADDRITADTFEDKYFTLRAQMMEKCEIYSNLIENNLLDSETEFEIHFTSKSSLFSTHIYLYLFDYVEAYSADISDDESSTYGYSANGLKKVVKEDLIPTLARFDIVKNENDLQLFEDNSSIRNVVDEQVLQQTMIFFSFGSLVAYSILKPGFLSFFSNF